MNSRWTLEESCESNGRWVEVYRYNDVLTLGAATTVLSSSLTMVDMGMTDYADVKDINVSMAGFTCRTADVASIDEAWGYIKSEAGM